MPLNYRKNNITYSIPYYDNISDLDGPDILQSGRFNLITGGSTKYIGLVQTGTSPSNESDLRVRRSGVTYSLAKNSLAAPTIVYDGDNYAAGYVETSYSYTPSITGKYISSISYSGSLPPGFSFNSSNGNISGTLPSYIGSWAPTITASNSRGSASATFTIEALPWIDAYMYADKKLLVASDIGPGVTLNDMAGAFAQDFIWNFGIAFVFSTAFGSLTSTSFAGGPFSGSSIAALFVNSSSNLYYLNVVMTNSILTNSIVLNLPSYGTWTLNLWSGLGGYFTTSYNALPLYNVLLDSGTGSSLWNSFYNDKNVRFRIYR